MVKASVSVDWVGCPDSNAWAADFDQMLTDVGAFPALRQVTIELKWAEREIIENNSGRPWTLTELQFPRV